GIERGAQLMADTGDELRLVFARQLQLPVLVLDFVEQPHVLDRDRRLVSESRYQVDLLVGERTHLGTRQCQNADSADDGGRHHRKIGTRIGTQRIETGCYEMRWRRPKPMKNADKTACFDMG